MREVGRGRDEGGKGVRRIRIMGGGGVEERRGE